MSTGTANKITDNSLPIIVVTRPVIDICHMQICAAIPPDQKDKIQTELHKLALDISGTTAGWALDKTEDPVPCNTYEGRWHYILEC